MLTDLAGDDAPIPASILGGFYCQGRSMTGKVHSRKAFFLGEVHSKGVPF